MNKRHKIALLAFGLAIFSTLKSAESGAQEFFEVDPYAKVTVVCYVETHLFVLVNTKDRKYKFYFKDLIWGIREPKNWAWLESKKVDHFILFSEKPMPPKKDFHWLMLNDKTISTEEKELVLPFVIVEKFPHKSLKIATIDKEMMKKIENIIDKIKESWDTKTNENVQ